MLPGVGLLLSLCASAIAGPPTVRTPLGRLRGHYLETRGGRKIAAFTSIPYAKPPVGGLRFKAPQPVEPWSDELDATQAGPVCVQRNPYTRQKEVVGQEDCLYLNIYTPLTGNEIDTERRYPVMVFIHGGGWMCGDATTPMYGPQYLLDKDVILVAMNYRLGPLGFLSTQDEHCPGNNGLKDQQEALRFIQKTIHSFGGDNSSVTIFGESAGGASVHYHMLSKTSAGLFHKAISESGTALVPWAEAPPGEGLRNAFRLAKFLGCPQAPSELMLDCLRTRDSYDIINTEYMFYTWDYEPMTPFKAVEEPELPGAFLTASPRKAPATAAVPWITGLNKDEGCLKSVWITANSSRYQEFMSAFKAIAPVTFYYDNSPYADVITSKIRDVYFNGGDTAEIKTGILDIYTDSYFAYPAVEAIELTFNYTKNPVFLYELTYRAANSFSQIFGDAEGDYGICHADELMHLFPINFLSKPFTDKDLEISELLITLWTNFAKSGDPNKPNKLPFRWEPATGSKGMEYLEIGKEQKMRDHLASRSRVWGSLPLWHSIKTRRFIDEL
ncbi:unnamed protein product, partial [Iphiclides podalirius]